MSEIRCIHCGERVEGITCIEENKKLPIFAHRACHERAVGARTCPDCHSALRPPASMNIRPEGYVCESCMMYYDADLMPMAKILYGGCIVYEIEAHTLRIPASAFHAP